MSSAQLIVIGAVGALAYFLYKPARPTGFSYDPSYMHGKPLTPPPINHWGMPPHELDGKELENEKMARAIDQFAQSQSFK